MAVWRFGIGWSEAELRRHLEHLAALPVNFDTLVEEITAENGWTVDGSDDVLGCERPGPPEPDGLFMRARRGLIHYDFSDPRIVVGHFDPERPVTGRDMLLEIKVFGLRYLNGVRVHSVREESDEHRTLFGFRYDTLEGHIERGYEWFLLTKDHATGEVRFVIQAHWQLGQFPNWWSHLGFRLVGDPFRRLWRRLAPLRLKRLARRPMAGPVAAPGHLAHRGDVEPRATRRAR